MVAPEPYMDLELGLDMVNRAYLDFIIKGLPKERQKKFTLWLDKANMMLNPPEQEMAEEQLQSQADAQELQEPLVEEQLPGDISEEELLQLGSEGDSPADFEAELGIEPGEI